MADTDFSDHHNLIVLKGAPFDKVYDAFGKWMNLYRKEIPKSYVFKILPDDYGRVFLKGDDRLSNEEFYFLFNYLKYPEGIDYKADMAGYTTGKEENALKSKEIMVYIPDDDTEYDNVNIVTQEGDSFKLDFGWNLKEIESVRKYEAPPNTPFENWEQYTTQDAPEIEEEDEKTFLAFIKSPSKRLAFVVGLAAFAIAVSWLFYLDSPGFKTFGKFNFFIGWLSALVLMGDIAIMNDLKLYLASLTYGALFLVYGIFITGKLHADIHDIGGFGLAMPISMLILQYPFRMIFVTLIGSEPDIFDRKSLPDGLYAVIVTLLSLFSSIKLIEIL